MSEFFHFDLIMMGLTLFDSSWHGHPRVCGFSDDGTELSKE
jgi:hypothetical protein